MVAVRNILLGLLAASWCFGGGAALADKRVALVIGNSGYERVARLGNPVNDAKLMAETLRAAGFDSVDLRSDLKIADMRRALRDFIETSRDADIAAIYYAGHGMEVDGINYLIPVDAVLDRDTDIHDEGLSLERVLVAVEPARKLRLVILDACRDSPFAKSMKRTLAARAIGRGLAKVEPTSPNTLIAFASKAGSTASDGDGSTNSPFTASLVKHVTRPGVDLRKAFGYVRDDVLKNTGNRQEPYLYGSLGGEDVPLVPAQPTATRPQGDPLTPARRDFELALQAGDRDAMEAFLRAFPEGFYADLARVQLKKIAAEEARAAAAETARLAEQEKIRLVTDSPRQDEQAKAAAAAKATEEARIAAENARQVEQAKAAEQARLATEKAAEDNKQKLAALTSTDKRPEQAAVDLPRVLQSELRRVGCGAAAVDGNWSATSQKALDLFNRHAGTKLDVKTASADALDAVRARTGRVCPLICDTDYRADGDRCVKITCGAGYRIGDEGICEKIETRPAARREEPKPRREPSERAKLDALPAKPQASGKIICTQGGCRPLRAGCEIAMPKSGSQAYAYERCN
ncbi:MAG: caspase family protein [Bradyrhizobium sp.]